MGETYHFESPSFNSSIRIQDRPDRLTSDAGALAVREVAEKLGLLDLLAGRLHDPRKPDKVTHPLRELLATDLLLRAQGWGDQDDADRLRNDPALRLAVSTRRGDAPLRSPEPDPLAHIVGGGTPDGLASQPTLSRLMASLSTEHNRGVLRDSLATLAGRRIRGARGHRRRHVAVDIDALPIVVEGHQPESEYNGYAHARIYHPLVATLGEERDLVDAMLRHGKAHSAESAGEFILRVVDRVRQEVGQVVSVRLDAGFPSEPLLHTLEKNKIHYVARIRNNPVLDRKAQPYLEKHAKPTASSDGEWLYEERYRAGSWSRPRRAVLVIQERPGELFPHHFWLITSWTWVAKPRLALLEHYRRRGNAEAAMGELMTELQPALSSSPRPKTNYRGRLLDPDRRHNARDSFAVNEVILLLNLLAYGLMHALRKELEAGTHRPWSIRKLRENVLKTAARFLLHARYVDVVIPAAAARLWEVLWFRLHYLRHTPSRFAVG